MELRRELMPPVLDEALVARLTELAAELDGAEAGMWEENLAEFNRLAGSDMTFEEFQGIYGGEDHEDYVRRELYRRHLKPDLALSQAEMTEIVSRVRSGENGDFYLELFRVNCQHPSGTDLIYWPDQVPELPQDRAATDAEVAELALRGPA